MAKQLIAGALLSLLLVSPAEAAQVCAWLLETNKPDDVLSVDVWVEADGHLEFLYKIGGAGLVSALGKAHSPGSGTYILEPRQAANMWGFGATFAPPGKIDITVELHRMPADILSTEVTPLLAKFSFQRTVPKGEKKAPKTLAKKQCAKVKG